MSLDDRYVGDRWSGVEDEPLRAWSRPSVGRGSLSFLNYNNLVAWRIVMSLLRLLFLASRSPLGFLYLGLTRV